MADRDESRPLFAAIPLQAIGCRAMSAAHFHVLAAVAWHDQLGANGIGCYASLKTLARETGLAATTVSECTGELEGFGFLRKTRHPLNRRTKVYSLIYKGNPRILPETGKCPAGDGAEGTKLPESGNDPGATLRVEKTQVPEGVEQTGSEYITRSVREKEKPPPPANTESAAARDCPSLQEREQSRCNSAVETEEKTRAREQKKEEEDAALLEEKISREALAAKEGADPSEWGRLTWVAWINVTYAIDRNTAAEKIIGWDCAARGDHERVNRLLCEAYTSKPSDIGFFMVARLSRRDETKGEAK